MAPSDNFLHRVDLNLLKVFKAVHSFRQTTAAANHLGLTQPAVSQSLKRLRNLVDDPLFVPTKSGMEPTARANELVGPVNDALSTIERAFRQTSDFEAAGSQQQFRIGMLDYAMMILAPSLAAVISEQAPDVTIEISYIPQADASQLLLNDELDLVTGPFPKHASSLKATHLFSDKFVVISTRNHAALTVGVSRATINKLSFVEIPVTYQNVGKTLEVHGVRPKNAMQVPTFASACYIVGESDFLAIVPEWIAKVHQKQCGLAIHDLPVDIEPMQISALIHRRNSSDGGLKWLLDVLVNAGNRA
jgi:DNA-binding transcriptional LysR family regulator